jgi:hypothetical protein
MEDWLRAATLARCKVESRAECHRWKCVRLTHQEGAVLEHHVHQAI